MKLWMYGDETVINLDNITEVYRDGDILNFYFIGYDQEAVLTGEMASAFWNYLEENSYVQPSIRNFGDKE